MTQAEPSAQSGADNEIQAVALDHEDIPIGGAAPAQTAQEQAAQRVEELEIEVRDRTLSPDESRDLALGVLRLVGENVARMTAENANRALALLRENVSSDYLDPDFWRGLGMVLQYQIDEVKGLVQRRLRGEYTTDQFGLDTEVVELLRPFASFLYKTWWRVGVEGLEFVPDTGRALLLANRAGAVPWDTAVIATALLDEHPASRLTRNLYPSWFSSIPVLAPVLPALGQVPALRENAERLLEADELVCAYPEGVRGAGKLLRDRYKVGSFGRGGFVQAALRTGAPIVPVAVIGSEETYPVLANARPLARALRLPYFPITPTFPWLGAVGLVPLPTRWTLVFHPPISTADYGPEAADDTRLVAELAERARGTVQTTLDVRVPERKSWFF
ncbi:MAG TPA: lysophospholipid acyltransferase family protein [Roseiflexaceae bacterium]|nr:lysophospholipid acyltransferase family protein [Roseiflexaceae bacterium]